MHENNGTLMPEEVDLDVVQDDESAPARLTIKAGQHDRDNW